MLIDDRSVDDEWMGEFEGVEIGIERMADEYAAWME